MCTPDLFPAGELQGAPAVAGLGGGEGQAEFLRPLLQDGHVALVESTQQQGAAGGEDGGVGVHVVQEDVAVDVGDDYVEGRCLA